ncbi:MAG: hypothetical protein H6571_22125 [Lewinellaceae bacterium]|nr:hypothetical protein [Lewinellaceae bacterium]
MKNVKINLMAIAAMIAILFSSCDKLDLVSNNQFGDILGTYTGTMVNDNDPGTIFDATAVVTMGIDSILQIHCFTEHFDTTIMLDTYHHGDSIMVCNTGQDFFNEYGHHQSGHSNNCNGMMGNGMMGNTDNPSCEWEEHMANDHNPGDRHFGSFNTLDNSFGYDFGMQSNGLNYFKKFRGTKE